MLSKVNLDADIADEAQPELTVLQFLYKKIPRTMV